METLPPPLESTSSPAPAPALGLAIASLVLGLLASILSFLLIGSLLGIIGLVLGLVYLKKHRRPAGMARWGVALSVLGIVASIGCGILYYTAYQKFTKLVESGTESSEPDYPQWEGVLAPDLAVTTLDGQVLKLSELKGKRVVLDFWATWCPPCRKEIPHFVQLAKETSRDQLVIVGISSEDAKKLKEFVQKEGVNYPIGSAQNPPTPFAEVRSIPTTFFIDRKGVIQKVVVGYHDYDALKKLALAEDMPGTPKPAPVGTPTLPDASQMLKPSVLWSKSIPGAKALCVGDWENDGSVRVLVAAGSKLHVLDLAGAETSSIPLPGRFAQIECGRNKTKGARLLGYSNWGKEVAVMDHTGKPSWKVNTLSGVDGAHWGDLDGDGTDELVVGMNGGGGLSTWSAEGSQLWSTSLGNVWNQAIVSATANQPARVLASEAGGSVKVFDAQGKLLQTLKPNGGYYAQMAAGRTGDKTIQIMGINGNKTVAFDDAGKVAWTTTAIGSHAGWRINSFASGDLKGDGSLTWAFIDGSATLVIAAADGHKLASLPNAKELTGYSFASRPGQTGVLVTLGSNGTVQTYSFQP